MHECQNIVVHSCPVAAGSSRSVFLSVERLCSSIVSTLRAFVISPRGARWHFSRGWGRHPCKRRVRREMKGVAGAAAVTRHKPGPRKLRPLAGPATRSSSGELAKARVGIAELERKIGQQALDIEFFSQSLARLG